MAMDVTLLFDDYLAAKGARPVLQEPFDVSKLNGFMNDAYRINSLLNDLVRYLRLVRSPYLALQASRGRTKASDSTAKSDHVQPFTEQQRKNVDEAMKRQLKQIDTSLDQLAKDAETDMEVKYAIRAKKQEKRGFGRLGRWAAGGAAAEKSPEELEEDALLETQKAHRDGVIFSLRVRLQQAGKVQEDMVSTRLNREIERSHNILSKVRADRFDAHGAFTHSNTSTAAITSPHTLTAVDLDLEADAAARREREHVRKDLEAQMTPAQLKQLQSEETVLLKHYSAELDKIQRAQASVVEIANLQTELTLHLNVQAEGISQLVSDSFEIGGNVREGNKQLEKAKERFRPAQWAFYAAVGTGAFLVLWDAVF